MERVSVKQQVYYHLPQKGWLRGVVEAVLENEKAQVVNAATGATETVPLTQIHGYIEQAYDPNDPDLFHLSDLHVATTLYCIKERFEKLKQQYSIMGEMILSVNPFQLMSFNSDAHREEYLNSAQTHLLPPHIWQVAQKGYTQIVIRGLGNQSVVISGESGSGKTENTKMLISYLGQVSYMHSSNSMQKKVADKVAECLKWSNPVLESFGNARTVRNDNSSRFGKYTKLYFDPSSGVMVGGQTVTYLLEKSRLLLQAAGERNYHIFYEMLAGLTPEEKKELGGLKTARDYKCLSGGKTFDRHGVDGRVLNDAQEFQNVLHAFTAIGVSADVQKSILKVLASILHLLELEFDVDQNDKACIKDEMPFHTACSLLQVDPALLLDCFIVKSHTSLVTIYANKAEAEGFRGAFCKALYLGLFDRIVNFVNTSIESMEDISHCKYIGLLDIFGFENFTRNSFEQLCINFANESLQNHYNKYTFLNDEAECEQEGIEIPKIVFPDNSACVRMFDQKKTGIFSVLNEECHFKGGTVERFTQNLWDTWAGKSKYFVQPKSTVPNQFGVNHYAAFVNYNTEEWLEKNTDRVKEEAYQCILNSGDPFIQTLAPKDSVADNRKQTVALRFQEQLTDLREELESTETQFIRCIKPNMEASPNTLDNCLVSSQLESAGVLQTIALKRQGYPVRRLIEQFCRYFCLIMPQSTLKLLQKKDFPAAAKSLLVYYQKLYDWQRPHYAIGHTKVFLRAEVWSSIERLLLRRKAWLLRRCVPFLLRWVYTNREIKRLAEERRKEELRQAKAERERLIAQIKANGFTRDQMEWVEELATLFPTVDVSILIDVVAVLPKREESLAAVTDMQKQCVDSSLASTVMRVMSEAEVRPSVVKAMVEGEVTTLARLSQCDQAELKRFGMTDAEVAAVTRTMMKEQSSRVKLERLQGSIGTAQLEKVVGEVKRRVLTQSDFATKVDKLTEMGFPRKHAELALTHYSGNVQKAAERLLQGSVAKHIHEKPPHGDKGRWTSLDPEVQRLVKLGVTKLTAKQNLFLQSHTTTRKNIAMEILGRSGRSVMSIAASSSSPTAFASLEDTGAVTLWDTRLKRKDYLSIGQGAVQGKGDVTELLLASDRHMAVVLAENVIMAYDLRKQSLVHSFTHTAEAVMFLCGSHPNGASTTLIADENGAIIPFDLTQFAPTTCVSERYFGVEKKLSTPSFGSLSNYCCGLGVLRYDDRQALCAMGMDGNGALYTDPFKPSVEFLMMDDLVPAGGQVVNPPLPTTCSFLREYMAVGRANGMYSIGTVDPDDNTVVEVFAAPGHSSNGLSVVLWTNDDCLMTCSVCGEVSVWDVMSLLLQDPSADETDEGDLPPLMEACSVRETTNMQSVVNCGAVLGSGAIVVGDTKGFVTSCLVPQA